jgi:hypothetical protein
MLVSICIEKTGICMKKGYINSIISYAGYVNKCFLPIIDANTFRKEILQKMEF